MKTSLWFGIIIIIILIFAGGGLLIKSYLRVYTSRQRIHNIYTSYLFCVIHVSVVSITD